MVLSVLCALCNRISVELLFTICSKCVYDRESLQESFLFFSTCLFFFSCYLSLYFEMCFPLLNRPNELSHPNFFLFILSSPQSPCFVYLFIKRSNSFSSIVFQLVDIYELKSMDFPLYYVACKEFLGISYNRHLTRYMGQRNRAYGDCNSEGIQINNIKH